MESIGITTRRTFVKLAVMGTGIFLTGINIAKAAFEETVSNVKARMKGTYDQDARMKYRKSQDNPEIKQIYREFLHEPNSHEAHHLLHTKYTDRSKKILQLDGKGIKATL